MPNIANVALTDENGTVSSIVVADLDSWSAPAGTYLRVLPEDSPVAIGWSWSDVKDDWVNPRDHPA